MPPRYGLLASLRLLAPLFLAVTYVTLRLTYALPEPLTAPTDAAGRPQISEANIIETTRYLSEEIGYRTVGTTEHALADAWMLTQAEGLVRLCEDARRANPDRRLECEVWHQRGSGKHRFDMMSKRLYKTYENLTNIIVRISDGTSEGKAHAILANSHVDSTLPSPGAADDALAVGVMLDCARVLIQDPTWKPTHSIILLFNNAEESLQDGSHLYSTQHPTASTVRSVINLEAAGSTGGELLFQATSEQMIVAYSHVPRPMGTIIASDIFKTGIMLSDTDFRQFVEYLNVTGLDLAVVGNSYVYHMRSDTVENIQPGVAQHMAENTLAILKYLASSDSTLTELAAGAAAPTSVYLSYLGVFIMIKARTASILYIILLGVAMAVVRASHVDPAPALRKGDSVGREVGRGARAVVLGVLGAVVGANTVAVLMDLVLGRPMSWFTMEASCIALYGPPALAGALGSQLLLGPVREKALLNALLVLQAALALAMHLAGVGSGVVFALNAVTLLNALVMNAIFAGPKGEIGLLTYALGGIIPLASGLQIASLTLDVFVPLTGRTGADAPAEYIIASIVAFSGAYSLPLTLPFVHRAGRASLRKAALVAVGASVIAIAVFSARDVFDTKHPRRLLTLHMENTTTGAQHYHLASLDRAPGFDQLVAEIAQEFGVAGVQAQAVRMHDWNPDWNVIYPVSAFLSPHKFDIEVAPEGAAQLVSGDSIAITAHNDVLDLQKGTRSLTLRIEHPNVIWTTIAFDAHVLAWSLDDNPPEEHARHHVKEASFHGTDAWSLDLVLKLPQNASAADALLRVDHVGIREKAMWPAKEKEKALGGRAMEVFEEVDRWLEEKYKGSVDAMMIGCVGGVTII